MSKKGVVDEEGLREKVRRGVSMGGGSGTGEGVRHWAEGLR